MANDYFKTDEHGRRYAGDHILLDIWGGNALYDAKWLQRVIEKAAELAGATVIDSRYQSFGEGHGVSGVTLLSESHISVHTWPERGFAAFDIFMCGNKCLPMIAAQYINSALMPDHFQIKEEKRGLSPTEKHWGHHLVLDLTGCDPERLKDKKHIERWCWNLVQDIRMMPYGPPVIEHFAKDNYDAAGYTLVQLIETSAITAHFAENIGKAYIDIFSCKEFDEKTAVFVCQKAFRPTVTSKKSLKRG